jgi:simple sugar transport system permease protein
MTSTDTSLVKNEKIRRNPLIAKFFSIRELGPFVLLVILGIIFANVGPAFLSPMNIGNMLAFIPELGIMALGMTMLLTAGEFDLSLGAVFGFCPVFLFILYNQKIMPFEAAFIVSLLAATLIGLANGYFVTKVGITSLITTIGMQMMVRGAALFISNGYFQATWHAESWIKSVVVGQIWQAGDFKLLASLFWFVGLAALFYYIQNHTRFGNWSRATGGNAKSARARGVNTDRTKIILFVICSLLAGFAGIMDSLRIQSAYPLSGTGYELEIMAMVVIGGTSLYGGRGTIIGTIIGVFLLRMIQNGIIIIGVPGLAYNIFVGAIIVLMMSVYAVIEKRQIGEG